MNLPRTMDDYLIAKLKGELRMGGRMPNGQWLPESRDLIGTRCLELKPNIKVPNVGAWEIEPFDIFAKAQPASVPTVTGESE
jgi:hypothetical protein